MRGKTQVYKPLVCRGGRYHEHPGAHLSVHALYGCALLALVLGRIQPPQQQSASASWTRHSSCTRDCCSSDQPAQAKLLHRGSARWLHTAPLACTRDRCWYSSMSTSGGASRMWRRLALSPPYFSNLRSAAGGAWCVMHPPLGRQSMPQAQGPPSPALPPAAATHACGNHPCLAQHGTAPRRSLTRPRGRPQAAAPPAPGCIAERGSR